MQIQPCRLTRSWHKYLLLACAFEIILHVNSQLLQANANASPLNAQLRLSISGPTLVPVNVAHLCRVS